MICLNLVPASANRRIIRDSGGQLPVATSVRSWAGAAWLCRRCLPARRSVGHQSIDLDGVVGLPCLNFRFAKLRDLGQHVNTSKHNVDMICWRVHLALSERRRSNLPSRGRPARPRRDRQSCRPLERVGRCIKGSITSGEAAAPSSATRPVESVAVWPSASIRKSSIIEKPLRSSLKPKTPQRREDRRSSSKPTLRHSRIEWPD